MPHLFTRNAPHWAPNDLHRANYTGLFSVPCLTIWLTALNTVHYPLLCSSLTPHSPGLGPASPASLLRLFCWLRFSPQCWKLSVFIPDFSSPCLFSGWSHPFLWPSIFIYWQFLKLYAQLRTLFRTADLLDFSIWMSHRHFKFTLCPTGLLAFATALPRHTNMFLLLLFPFPKLALPNAQLFKPRNFRLILDDSLFLTQVVTSSLSLINSASKIKYWSIYLFPFPASLNQSGMNYHISVPCPL